jgi:peptide/nickel transport system permease protein
MFNYVVRRIAYSIPVLILASLLVFIFVHETFDPLAKFRVSHDFTLLAREGLRAGVYQQPCRHFFTTDAQHLPVETCAKAPVMKQYWFWLSHFLRGQMGNSFTSNRAVSTQISDALFNTIQLIFWGVLVSAIVAVLVGVYSAVRQYSVLDYTFTGLSFAGLSMPPFFFGLIAIDFFAFRMQHWFGMTSPPLYSIGFHGVHAGGFVASNIDYARHLVLPVLTLTVQIVAEWSRYQRSSMLDVMSSDYIRTAKAKGVPRRRVIFKHGLRNALIPLVTVMAIDIGALFGGLLVTETIFSIPGMGRLFVDALTNGDTNVLLPWLMVSAVFIVGFNLLADVLYGVLDPRVRLA